ncbi:MAG: hypothetical protein HY901_26640 [Deltaproteobacteria bacterium]|nr:hypothetical protein [Deltaproteobacteria bacterium]
MRWNTPLIFALALLAGCATASPGPTPGAATAAAYKARPLSVSAARLFELANDTGPGPGLFATLDVERLRELGLVSTAAPAAPGAPETGTLAEAMTALLAAGAGVVEADSDKLLLAQLAVTVSALSEWTSWPHVQKIALVFPLPNPEAPDALKSALLLMAVDGSEAANREVLQAFLALDRAHGPHGGAAVLAAEGGLCIARPDMPFPLCLRGGDGFYAMGAQEALDAASQRAATNPPSPPAVTTPASVPAPLPAISLRAGLEKLGQAKISVQGAGALEFSMQVTGLLPNMAEQLEKSVRDALSKYDAHRLATRQLLERALQETNARMAGDALAPAGLKAALAKTTPESITDRHGDVTQIRESLQIEHLERGMALRFTIPESTLKRTVASLSGSGGTVTIATVGVLAAIAVPNFIKYQCRAKQGEAQTALQALHVAAMSAYAQTGRWPSGLEALGWEPPANSRYNYCFGDQCIPCSHAGCARVGAIPNPCPRPSLPPPPAPAAGRKGARRSPPVRQPDPTPAPICAFGDLNDSPDSLDLWVLEPGAAPQQLSSDCQ